MKSNVKIKEFPLLEIIVGFFLILLFFLIFENFFNKMKSISKIENYIQVLNDINKNLDSINKEEEYYILMYEKSKNNLYLDSIIYNINYRTYLIDSLNKNIKEIYR